MYDDFGAKRIIICDFFFESPSYLATFLPVISINTIFRYCLLIYSICDDFSICIFTRFIPFENY